MTEEVKVKEKEKEVERLVEVKLIARGDRMALVEAVVDGMPVRVSIPNKELKEGGVTVAAFSRGTPYGIPYEILEFPKVTAKDIAKIMRTYNLWTPDDIRKHPRELQSALTSIYSEALATILTYIKNK